MENNPTYSNAERISSSRARYISFFFPKIRFATYVNRGAWEIHNAPISIIIITSLFGVCIFWVHRRRPPPPWWWGRATLFHDKTRATKGDTTEKNTFFITFKFARDKRSGNTSQKYYLNMLRATKKKKNDGKVQYEEIDVWAPRRIVYSIWEGGLWVRHPPKHPIAILHQLNSLGKWLARVFVLFFCVCIGDNNPSSADAWISRVICVSFEYILAKVPNWNRIGWNEIILTFLMSRLICLLPNHQDKMAAGLEPELTHSMSYDLSADTNRSLVRMCTAAGFTAIYIYKITPQFRCAHMNTILPGQ